MGTKLNFPVSQHENTIKCINDQLNAPSALLITVKGLQIDNALRSSNPNVKKTSQVLHIQSPKTIEEAKELKETLEARGYIDMGNHYIGKEEEERIRNIKDKPIDLSYKTMFAPLPMIDTIDFLWEHPLYIICEGYYEKEKQLVTNGSQHKRIFKLKTS